MTISRAIHLVARVAIALLILQAAGCSYRSGGKPRAPEIRIAFEQSPDGALAVSYSLSAARARLDLGPSLGGFRESAWTVETPRLAITSVGGRDFLVAPEGESFSAARITVHPYKNNFVKQYEPVTKLNGGSLVYTGHFWPWNENGRRLEAEFDFVPGNGAHAAAFGEQAAAFEGWSSPFDHPAFVYLGALAPVRADGLTAIMDPAVPDWVEHSLPEVLPEILRGLARAFGRELVAPPEFFIIMEEEKEAGRLQYFGDALPGQVEIRLSGGGWREESPKARRILLEGTAHEAAHLWQLAIRPSGGGAPDWIHEGGANAIAGELIAGGPENAKALASEAAACRTALAGRSLAEAEARGAWRASYACGHVIAVVAARARGDEDVADFWRAFIDRAEAKGGYDEALFLSMIEEKAGGKLAEAVGLFVRTAYAAPDKELALLLSAAEKAGRAAE